jgi:WD40 repeat protein
LHGSVRAPETAGAGKAIAAISFDAWKDGHVAPSRQEIDILPPKTRLELEAVSPRLKGSLVFPDRAPYIQKLHYSPDGRQLLAGSYPAGTVQLYDVATGRQLTKIETGRSARSHDFFFVTPNWRTLYAPRQTKRAHTRVEKDGKKLTRWDCEGEVRTWDLATGELKDAFRHDPPRGIFNMRFSSDGRFFSTLEELSGESDTGVQRSVTLWNAVTKEHRSFPELQFPDGMFSPDGKTISTVLVDQNRDVTGIKVYDVESLTEQRSFSFQPGGFGYVQCFSPDGRIMVGAALTYPNPKDRSDFTYVLKCRDAVTGEELLSFPAEERKDLLVWPTFSHDGKTLVTRNRSGEKSRLYVFDVPGRKLAKTIMLGEKGLAGIHAFSPDDKWLAVITQYSTPPGIPTPDPEDRPQARIHLIEVASGEIRETMTMPQGGAGGMVFSPDGKTLATGGHGRVLLWDLSTPPGSGAATNR